MQGEKGDKGDTGLQGLQGIQGKKGDTGAQGQDGTNGATPVKGTDYFTQADIDSLANATGLSKERVEELKKAAALYLEKNAAQAATAEKSQVISEEGTSQDA